MPCVLFSGVNKKLRIHLPQVIQKVTCNYFPSYLFRRNVIGPTSCLVARRNLFPKFDENLRWLVDVDMYWRLLISTKSFSIDNDLQIGSISNRTSSITQTIAGEVDEIRISELNYLNQKYKNASIWLEPNVHRVIFVVEGLFWGSFKGFYLLYTQFLRVFGR
jgi:hypothetical protein